GTEAFHEDVGLRSELAHDGRAFFGAQIDGDGALPAIEAGVGGRLFTDGGREGADGIAFPRLDLHDVRAEVGEGHGRVGPRDVAREVHHAQAGEGAFARDRAHRSRTIAKPRPPAAQTE